MFYFFKICRKCESNTPCLGVFNSNNVYEGFYVFAQSGGLWWEVALDELVPILAECGDSFYNVIAYFFDGNGTIQKVVFSSSLRGEVSTLWFL